MLNAIIRFSLNHRLAVLIATAIILAYGAITMQTLPVDVFPDITKPTVTVMAEAHGMAPEEVETRVTLPIESFLNGLPGVERVRSQSGIGLSVVYVEFAWGTEIYLSRQLVQEKLNLAKERLPKDVSPVMGPVGSLMGQIQQIAISAPEGKVDPMSLRDFAEWTLRPRLMTIPGVAQVISIGGGLKQFQILVSAEKLNRFQLSIEQIDHELTQISQNTTGGYLEKDVREYLVRNIGAIESAEDIRKTLIGMHFGRPVLVSDIAEVKESPRLKRGDGSFNGKPAVIVTIQKQPGADTVKISRAIQKAIDELRPAIPAGIEVNPNVFKQADFIRTSIAGIQKKLWFGSLLVCVILFIFLANFRMSAITLTAIPLSFLVTAIVMKLFGLTVNTMTLGGLAIAIGELVDDSIVDVENVFRRLRENAQLKNPKPLLRVIYDASSEVRNSIVIATLIIALVFLPLFQLSGLEGRLFAPLGFAYLTALLASLVVSLTLTPVLCSYFLRGPLKAHRDTRFVIWLKDLDRKVLEWALPRANLTLGVAVALFLVGLALIPFMGRDFLPKFNEGTAMISIVAPPGVNLTESNRVGSRAEAIMLSFPEIKSVSRRTGRAELDEHAAGVEVSEIDVDFNRKGRPREQVLNEIRDKLKAEFPLAGISVGQPISHLIDHMLSGVPSAIAIKVFGPELATLREQGVAIRDAINGIPGLVDLRLEQQVLIPQAKIYVLRDEAAKYGLSAGEVTSLLESAFNGAVLAQIVDGAKLYDVYFRFDDGSRADLEKMKSTVIKVMPDGRKILLSQVADVYETSGPNAILRENSQRRIVISGNVSGRDLGGVIGDIQERIGKLGGPPQGYHIVYGGQFESQKAATRGILFYSLFAVIGIFVLLATHFHSKSIALQVLATVPLAFTGGMIFLFLTDRIISVASVVGFITLCGIASRNSVMMISHYLHLMKFEGEKFHQQMVVRGSQERLVPVLMTAFVAALALLPLVFAKGQPGSEILHPVAVVIVGGLLSSTLLDVIITPVLFFKYGQSSAQKYLNYELTHERVEGE